MVSLFTSKSETRSGRDPAVLLAETTPLVTDDRARHAPIAPDDPRLAAQRTLPRIDGEEPNPEPDVGANSTNIVRHGLAEAEGRKRRLEVASKLARIMERIVECRGHAAMATHLQLLKRELSRSHDVLRPFPSESDYLSIVALVEANLAVMDWKDASRSQLGQIMNALAHGNREGPVTFDQYNRCSRLFRGEGLPTSPELELGADTDDLVIDQDD